MVRHVGRTPSQTSQQVRVERSSVCAQIANGSPELRGTAVDSGGTVLQHGSPWVHVLTVGSPILPSSMRSCNRGLACGYTREREFEGPNHGSARGRASVGRARGSVPERGFARRAWSLSVPDSETPRNTVQLTAAELAWLSEYCNVLLTRVP